MDLFSHLLWTHVLFRNRLWREEAMALAIIPDVSFMLILLYVIVGTPMSVGFDEAMLTMPKYFIVFYHLMHSFVVLGIVAFVVWKLKPLFLPALSAWALHICMDIPFHDGTFGTRFLYPILPDFYISGMTWADYRVLGISYFLMLCTYIYLVTRELRKHRRRKYWTPDFLDRAEFAIVGLINLKPFPVAHGALGNYTGTSGQLSGEDQDGPGEAQDSGAGTLPPPETG
ncbi:MAG: hypothetical protein Q7J68_01250 [Thermoplasmata archaeon]|nr:hypothetical protein [Thermoplasmata archaeon]